MCFFVLRSFDCIEVLACNLSCSPSITCSDMFSSQQSTQAERAQQKNLWHLYDQNGDGNFTAPVRFGSSFISCFSLEIRVLSLLAPQRQKSSLCSSPWLVRVLQEAVVAMDGLLSDLKALPYQKWCIQPAVFLASQFCISIVNLFAFPRRAVCKRCGRVCRRCFRPRRSIESFTCCRRNISTSRR